MSNQQAETLSRLTSADFSQPAWLQTILDTVTDKYARGYLEAMYVLYDYMCKGDDYDVNMQYLMRDVCELDIWGK